MVEVHDDRQRPLVLFRENGQAVFYRYRDMTDGDRDVCLRLYEALDDRMAIAKPSSAEELKEFLNFASKGPDICG